MSNNIITVRLDGLAGLAHMLSADLQAAAGNAAFAVATALQDRIAPYPPSTQANSPRPWTSGGRNSWYERGYGTRWARKDGSIGGRKSSQTMNRRWSIQRNGNSTTLSNGATYSPYVHRDGNSPPHQAGFHAARGWQTEVQGMGGLQRDGVIDAIVAVEVKKVMGT